MKQLSDIAQLGGLNPGVTGLWLTAPKSRPLKVPQKGNSLLHLCIVHMLEVLLCLLVIILIIIILLIIIIVIHVHPPIVQWFEHGDAKLQIVCSKPVHTCVCGMLPNKTKQTNQSTNKSLFTVQGNEHKLCSTYKRYHNEVVQCSFICL